MSLSPQGSNAADARGNTAGAPVRRSDVASVGAAAADQTKNNEDRTPIYPRAMDGGKWTNINQHHCCKVNEYYYFTSTLSPEMARMIDERRAIEEKTRGLARVVVEWCGIPEVNGTYNQVFNIDGDQQAVEMSDNVPMLWKRGKWEGKQVVFLTKIWFIVALSRVEDIFYTLGPLGHGWRATGKGINPAPTLRDKLPNAMLKKVSVCA